MVDRIKIRLINILLMMHMIAVPIYWRNTMTTRLKIGKEICDRKTIFMLVAIIILGVRADVQFIDGSFLVILTVLHCQIKLNFFEDFHRLTRFTKEGTCWIIILIISHLCYINKTASF